ncbi:ATP-binding protein [Piscinibacter sakaiensis]|uniref:ATP-binding protein n=1 Tax=Piscinibacter sakaiensis TaxID=1547922 RepID=UPI003AAC1AB5
MRLDVRGWLEVHGLGQWADRFESMQIDAEALALMSEAHLKELGIPIGPRLKLLAAMATLPRPEPAGAERRRLTVVFVDMVNSTALSSQLDPEDLRDLIRSYQQTVAAEVARFDGNVARFIGDGVLVYFGYPKAHEDDAERAVRAALAIVARVAGLKAPSGQALAAHIGIATGLVVVGELLGGGEATERAVLGETPNLAARLVDLAEAGRVVVSAQTRAQTGNLFEMAALPPRAVKGLPMPVAAHMVLAERAVTTRFDGHRGSRLTALVGRDEELATLQGLWQRAIGGHGQVVMLTGEAGIGKSRVVKAMQQRLRAQPHVKIVSQCSPYHSETALYPMIRQLTHDAGIDGAATADAKLDRLEALVVGATATDLALIAAMLGLDGEHRYGKLELTRDQQRIRTFDALLNHLLRIGRHSPLFWVLEDGHWIDPTTRELITYCIDRIADAPILAIVTARPDADLAFGQPANLHQIVLGKLGADDVSAMVSDLSRGKPVPDGLMREIVLKTDGVPLFIEELTKAVIESGPPPDAADAGGGPEPPPRQIAVPASLHDSLMARLDRHPALKNVAQFAACIGREFDRDLLAAITRIDADELSDCLARLESAQLIFRRGDPSHRLYVFKHALVRDAAYESLLKSRRQEIHSRLLPALEARPATPPELLARHASEARLLDKAIDYWQSAGTLAIAKPAYQEAIAHLGHALRLVDSMPDDPCWQARRLQLLMLLGQATIPLRGYSHSQTLEVFKRAEALTATMGDAAQRFSIAYAMWVIYYVRGDHQLAFDVAQRMLQGANDAESASWRLTAMRALGISQMILGEPAVANAIFDEAASLAVIVHQKSRVQRLAVAQRFGADPEIATQFHVALTLWALGRIDDARDLSARTVEAARAMGHVHTLGHALAHGAIVAVVARDAAEALRLSAETIVFAETYEMDLWRGYGAILNGYAEMLAGRSAPAVKALDTGLNHLARTQTGAMVPAHRAVHAYALAKQGRLEEAARQARWIREEIGSGTERYFWPDCLIWLGDYFQLEEADRPAAAAEAAYLEALAIARKQKAISWELRAASRVAACWQARGERSEAKALLAPLLQKFSQGGDTAPIREAEALLEKLL